MRVPPNVKLLFVLEVPDDAGDWQVERMWVEVTAASEGRYVVWA